MVAIISEHFWACWWLTLILGWGLLQVIDTFIARKWPAPSERAHQANGGGDA